MCRKLKECFENYYKDLYTQLDSAESSIILEVIGLPSIGTENNKILTSEITKQKLELQSLKVLRCEC